MQIAPLLGEGMQAFIDADYEKAYRCATECLNWKPRHAETLHLLGAAAAARNEYGVAMLAYMACEQEGGPEQKHELYNNMGNCLRVMQREAEAEAAWKRSLEIMEQNGKVNGDIYNNMATVCINSNRSKEAEDLCRKALAINPHNVHAKWNLCLALLEQGRFEEGWKLHKWGFFTGGRLNKQYDCAPWDGSPVKKLVVCGEQGQGDEILFASMIPDLPCENLIIDCHPRLADCFKRSFDPTAVYPTRKEPKTDWLHDHWPIDAKILMGDLGGVCRNRLSDFPREVYLKTNPAFDYALSQRLKALGPKPKIGVAWEGGTPKTHCNVRTPPFEHFARLFDAWDVDWVSLHYRPTAKEQLEGSGVHHWQAVIDDLDALTSLAKLCDVVITVDQTLVHQCGAVGANALVLLPVQCSWRYPVTVEGEDFSNKTPWYGDHLALVRQREDGDWGGVFERLNSILRNMIGSEHERLNQPGVPDFTEAVSRTA